MMSQSENNEIKHKTANIVYFFSGTGNSYYVAKEIALGMDAKLKPIVSLQKGDRIEADVLCFVFPVYEFKPPRKVTEIVENLSKIEANYTIAIGTYGVALASTLKHFEKSLDQHGITLAMGYGMKLPHNAVGSIGFSDQENSHRISRAEDKTKTIVTNIQKRTVGKVEKTSVFEDMIIIRQFPHVIKLMSVLIFKGAKSLEFTVNNSCINCHQCIKICPVNNVESVDGRISFKGNCTGCFACLQWCPKHSIGIGKYSFKELSIKRYHHPKVKVEDLFLNIKKGM
jgi:ferredoxin